MRRTRRIALILTAALALPAILPGEHRIEAAESSGDSRIARRWSKAQAWDWYRSIEPIRGCNYLPRTAVNSTEMWQGETFDPNTIAQELGWARDAGYNSIRVFLQYIVWQAEPKPFKKRLDKFLAICAEYKISAMLVPFCDCAFAGREPYLGKQGDPIPGVHNSQWVPSPGRSKVTDRSAWPDLERYIKDLVGTFGNDPRVLIWDLYNEPGNSGMSSKSLPLVEEAFKWARAEEPSQPLTVGAWASFDSEMSTRLIELSDVVSFHAYDPPKGVEGKIHICTRLERPVICSEWLRRQVGNDFQGILPLFSKHHVGWYHWGLVAGRTQTYMPWGSKKGDPTPKLWQHDVFGADGSPYNPGEIRMIKNFRFAR